MNKLIESALCGLLGGMLGGLVTFMVILWRMRRKYQ